MSARPSLPFVGGVPAPGQRLLGKYVVERVLGKGGMGVVVAARHEALGQPVAIKLLARRDEGDPDASEARARLLREARSTAALQSEHVVRVFDVGVLETGEPYIAMEFLAGEDLSQHLARRGPLPVADAVHLVLQACEALAEAHRIGIVHRDLKPANLFLTTRGDGSPLVKVLDFGISKVLAAPGEQLTTTGEAFGSPLYMSPEQMRDAKSVDQRTDIWALGVILHKLLTGESPFSAESATALCIAIVNDPPAPLRASRPEVPPELEALVLRCLEKDLARRWESVAHLASALAPFAPEEARAHVRRIERLSQREGAAPSAYASGSFSRPLAGADTLERTAIERTAPGWDASGAQRASRVGRLGMAGLAATTLVVGAGAALLIASRPPFEARDGAAAGAPAGSSTAPGAEPASVAPTSSTLPAKVPAEPASAAPPSAPIPSTPSTPSTPSKPSTPSTPSTPSEPRPPSSARGPAPSASPSEPPIQPSAPRDR